MLEVLALLLVAHGASGEDESAAACKADLSEFRMSLDVAPSHDAPHREASHRGTDVSEFRMTLDLTPGVRASYPGADLSEFRMSLEAPRAQTSPRDGDLGEFRTTF